MGDYTKFQIHVLLVESNKNVDVGCMHSSLYLTVIQNQVLVSVVTAMGVS